MKTEELFNIGDIVEVNAGCLKDINYTNRPEIGRQYKIRVVWGGDIWTYGLSHLDGRDAYIHISHKHVKKSIKTNDAFQFIREDEQ